MNNFPVKFQEIVQEGENNTQLANLTIKRKIFYLQKGTDKTTETRSVDFAKKEIVISLIGN